MRDYHFNLSDVEIINQLIFDSSVDFNEIQNLRPDNQVDIFLERREFENVKRSHFLFWSTSRWKGRKSLLRLTGIKGLTVQGVNEKFKDNHFVDTLEYNAIQNTLELKTVFGLTLSLELKDDFKGELIDLGKSNYGKGTSFTKTGFTTHEWTKYLRDRNYALQQNV